MTTLKKLIDKLCPNGVEFKPLWSLTMWDKKFANVPKEWQEYTFKTHNISAAKMKEISSPTGNIKLMSTGKFDGYAIQDENLEFIDEGEIITIPSGGSANIKYYNGKYINSGNNIAKLSNNSKSNLKFIWYYLQTKIDLIETFYRGGSVKHPEMFRILQLEIPVPPLEVQCEIVRILDNYTELTAELTVELTAELTARRKQYEYYKNLLFNYKNYKIHKLGEICDVRDGTHDSPKSQDEGKFLVTSKNIKNGKVNFDDCYKISLDDYNNINKRSKVDINDLLFTMIGTLGEVAIVDTEPNYAIKNVALIKTDNSLLSKFLYYYLSSKLAVDYIQNNKSKGSQVFIALGKLREMPILIPLISEQQRIVNILDKFETYCNDITKGLPAEIEMRKKQYEYYRDKLLTFKRLEA